MRRRRITFKRPSVSTRLEPVSASATTVAATTTAWLWSEQAGVISHQTALSLVSDHVEGTRLSEILRVADERGLAVGVRALAHLACDFLESNVTAR